MNPNLVLGNLYSKEEIEHAFNTNFGQRIKGITLRRSENDTQYIILFATLNGSLIYGDKIIGDIFYYKGEGADGNQKLTTANKALVNANIDKKIIFGFRQEDTSKGKFKYLGLISVLDWAYIDFEGRKVYEFQLKQEGIEGAPENTNEWNELKQQSSLPEPTLTGSTERTTIQVSSVVRDNVFRLKIKELYQNRCAVCKKRRLTFAQYPEVQAAHIYPKEKNGSDDLRNGIALCRLHHWAFDGGLMAISDDLKVIVRTDIKGIDDYEEIWKYENFAILDPIEPKYKPISLFLTEHRKIHDL